MSGLNNNQGHQIEGTEYIPKKEAKNRLRRRVLEAWGWSCAYCGAMLEERGATLDHVIPALSTAEKYLLIHLTKR